jgi:hypothetical protein
LTVCLSTTTIDASGSPEIKSPASEKLVRGIFCLRHLPFTVRRGHRQTEANGSAKADTDAAIEEFAAAVTDFVHGETNPAERTRRLRFYHGEFVAISKHPNLGEDDCYRLMVERAIEILDGELGIIQMELEHHELFETAPASEVPDFDLHFEGKSKEFGSAVSINK